MREAYLPNLLKESPKILGVSIFEFVYIALFSLGLKLMGLNDLLMLLFAFSLYGGIYLKDKFFPKRYFYFLLKRKRGFSWQLTVRRIKNVSN